MITDVLQLLKPIWIQSSQWKTLVNPTFILTVFLFIYENFTMNTEKFILQKEKNKMHYN